MSDKSQIHVGLKLHLEEMRSILGQNVKNFTIKTDNGTEYLTHAVCELKRRKKHKN